MRRTQKLIMNRLFNPTFNICCQKFNLAQASTLGEHFLASGPWIHQPMIHDVTKLKKRPRLGSLAARQTFFQAVDRLPRPGEVACIFSSLSSLNLLDQNWQRFGSLHKFTVLWVNSAMQSRDYVFWGKRP